MGFPEIMYLSKGQVRNLWPSLDKKQFKLDEFSAKASISLNPSAELGGKWSSRERVGRSQDDDWPPWQSGTIVRAIDAYVTKNARVGVWSDIYENPDDCDFYTLQGKLKFADPQYPTREIMHGWLAAESIDAIFCGELPKDQLRVSMSLENVAGIDRRGGAWHVWESGARFMLREMGSGFKSHGLFTLANATADSGPFARMVYLARRHR